jgi:hypothetical protein
MPRAAAPVPAPPPELGRWNQEAHGILSDVLETLRTFDDFQAFRVSTVAESSARLPAELAWDPPTSAAWDEATHNTRGLRGRADLLFTAVTTAKIDPNLLRDQRRLGEATHNLLDLADALSAYRDRINAMPRGDGTGALALLDKAWSQWASAAADWGISRSETIAAASA